MWHAYSVCIARVKTIGRPAALRNDCCSEAQPVVLLLQPQNVTCIHRMHRVREVDQLRFGTIVVPKRNRLVVLLLQPHNVTCIKRMHRVRVCVCVCVLVIDQPAALRNENGSEAQAAHLQRMM